jgi:hypothetical protein
MGEIQFPAETRHSLICNDCTSCGAHIAFCPRVSGVKWPKHDTEHSPPSSAKVNNGGANTFTHLYVFMAWFLIKQRDNFTLPFTVVDAKFTIEDLVGYWWKSFASSISRDCNCSTCYPEVLQIVL